MKLKSIISVVMISVFALSIVGCSTSGATTGKEGTVIIDAKGADKLLNKENVIFVDARTADMYADGHVKNAVNITREDVTINVPVSNMLAPKEQIQDILRKNGISNNSTVVIYDADNNMDAARLWWTLKVYGHENIKVVSGGFKALTKDGAVVTTDATAIKTTQYTAKDKNNDMIATTDEVMAQVNNKDKNVVLLDTRTKAEFDEGTIPGSILYDYINNDYKDGTFKSIQDLKIQYYEQKIVPEKTIIMYCKTSIRGAQTYLALYNAGYTKLKLYDGAWLEWSKDKSLPVQKGDSKVNKPAGDNKVQPDKSDKS